jgi:hypothetical protein
MLNSLGQNKIQAAWQKNSNQVNFLSLWAHFFSPLQRQEGTCGEALLTNAYFFHFFWFTHF